MPQKQLSWQTTVKKCKLCHRLYCWNALWLQTSHSRLLLYIIDFRYHGNQYNVHLGWHCFYFSDQFSLISSCDEAIFLGRLESMRKNCPLPLGNATSFCQLEEYSLLRLHQVITTQVNQTEELFLDKLSL